MAKLKIILGEDNPILRKKSTEIKKVDKSLKKLAKEMREAMFEADGVGLAAPQIGKNIRMFVMNMNSGTKNAMVVALINPVIVSHGEKTVIAEEGCLSLPGKYGKVERWKDIVLEYTDLDGDRRILELSDLNARVVQHETDHLDGVLFIDKLADKKTEDLLM